MEWGESTGGYAISAGKLEIIAHSTNARSFSPFRICSWNTIHGLPLAYLHADAAVTGICTYPNLNPAWVNTQDSNVSEMIWSSGWGRGRGVPVYVTDYMLCVNIQRPGQSMPGKLLAGDDIIAGLREVIRKVRFDRSDVPFAKEMFAHMVFWLSIHQLYNGKLIHWIIKCYDSERASTRCESKKRLFWSHLRAQH